MNIEEFFLIAIPSAGVGAIIVGYIFFYFLARPGKALSLWYLGAKQLHKLRLASHQRAIEADYSRQMNNAISPLQNQAEEVFSQSFRLRLLRETEEFAQMEDGDVVVYLKDTPRRDAILAKSAILYLEKGVIADARPYVDRKLLHAVDIVIAERVLAGFPGAHTYLQRHYMDEYLTDVPAKEYYDKATGLAEKGYLTRIILREFGGLPQQLKGEKSTRRVREEGVNFFGHVDQVVNPDEIKGKRLWRFYGTHFNVTIALIAKRERIEQRGLGLYKRLFQSDIEGGVRRVYLLAWGRRNNHIARTIAQWGLDTKLIARVWPQRYYQPSPSGTPLISDCITCYSAKAVGEIKLGVVDEVYMHLVSVVPEILQEKITIVELVGHLSRT